MSATSDHCTVTVVKGKPSGKWTSGTQHEIQMGDLLWGVATMQGNLRVTLLRQKPRDYDVAYIRPEPDSTFAYEVRVEPHLLPAEPVHRVLGRGVPDPPADQVVEKLLAPRGVAAPGVPAGEPSVPLRFVAVGSAEILELLRRFRPLFVLLGIGGEL